MLFSKYSRFAPCSSLFIWLQESARGRMWPFSAQNLEKHTYLFIASTYWVTFSQDIHYPQGGREALIEVALHKSTRSLWFTWCSLVEREDGVSLSDLRVHSISTHFWIRMEPKPQMSPRRHNSSRVLKCPLSFSFLIARSLNKNAILPSLQRSFLILTY